mmetsp:Transcript_97138/g.190780  ORF Transcript_97138/g.190780 Transcript_97138/m.190780 type:complete len:88 (-) Transcript_97138:18-281(-)
MTHQYAAKANIDLPTENAARNQCTAIANGCSNQNKPFDCSRQTHIHWTRSTTRNKPRNHGNDNVQPSCNLSLDAESFTVPAMLHDES